MGRHSCLCLNSPAKNVCATKQGTKVAHHPKYIGQKVDIIDSIPERYNNEVICSAELMVIRVNPEYIDPYYVLLFLKTHGGYNAIQSCIRGRTAFIIYSEQFQVL